MIDIRQKCKNCGKPMETKRVSQTTCSRKCSGALGGKIKTAKGFALLSKEDRHNMSKIGAKTRWS